MKKHLAWILALITVLAVLAACTTGSGDDTTVGDTTVTDPATAEPTDDMMEVAIEAMNRVIPENEGEDNW